ncbi:hypothetical protein MN608_11874 [Microdochium nivale]|nr:hypothetical protein MN608_11874 [Microdochium nivale]
MSTMPEPIPHHCHDCFVAGRMRDDNGLRTLTLLRREIPPVRHPGQSNEEYARRWFEDILMDAVESKTLAVCHEIFLGKFLARAVTEADRRATGRHQPRPSAPADFRPLQMAKGALSDFEFLNLEKNELCDRLVVLQRHNGKLQRMLNQIFSSTLEQPAAQDLRILRALVAGFERPFYRYHRPLSNMTTHEPGVGLLSGAWHECCDGMPRDARDRALRHLEGTDCSSPFISVSDRPRRIRNFIDPRRGQADEDDVVYVISPDKLRQLGVTFTRSTSLVAQAGYKTYCRAHPNGIRHATPSHWLVEEWVPEACIVATLTMEEFEACCAAVGITGRKYVARGETPENDIAPSVDEMLRHRDVWRARHGKTRANADARAEGQGVSSDNLKTIRAIEELAKEMARWSL